MRPAAVWEAPSPKKYVRDECGGRRRTCASLNTPVSSGGGCSDGSVDTRFGASTFDTKCKVSGKARVTKLRQVPEVETPADRRDRTRASTTCAEGCLILDD
jgi:hypothetical protein